MAITLAEYKVRAEPISEIEDPEEVAAKAGELYQELVAGMTVTLVTHDWRDYNEHMREVCKQVRKLEATCMHYFPPFHDFPNGSLDTIVTVISKEDIDEEFAEALVDLVVNLGAKGS